MFNKEFDEIYRAIDKIYEMSEFSGWINIANNITNKVNELEDKLKQK
jgi:hypothetical protein